MSTKQLIIAGGSGYLGCAITKHLMTHDPDAWNITILSRSRPKVIVDFPQVQRAQWDGRSLGNWIKSLEQSTHVLNLAGRSVDCRKTPARCDEILRSRVESTRVLGNAFKQLNHEPQVWVQMSTAHIYGDPPHAVCDESSPFGYGIAPTVGQAWEREFDQIKPSSSRNVILRTSFVLGKHGGAFPTLKRVAKLGLGGRVGSGTQGISWIHEHDMNRIFQDALTNDQREGVYIASGPSPVSYTEMMRTIRKRVHQPIALPASEIGLRLLCATILDTDPELVLYGRYCVPKRLQSEGFTFEYPTLDDAMRELIA